MGVYSDTLKKRGLRHGSGSKRGVLCTGHDRKRGGGVLGTGQARKGSKGGSYARVRPEKGIFTAAHPGTGVDIIWCPPPPHRGVLTSQPVGGISRGDRVALFFLANTRGKCKNMKVGNQNLNPPVKNIEPVSKKGIKTAE